MSNGKVTLGVTSLVARQVAEQDERPMRDGRIGKTESTTRHEEQHK